MNQTKKIVSFAAAFAAAASFTPALQAGYGSCGSCGSADSVQASAAKPNIVATAKAAGSFNTLVAAVKAAGLKSTLMSDGPFTVFAPTDAAFAALPEGTVESLLKPENRDQLAGILTYHVVPGTVMSSDVKPGTVATVGGKTFDVTIEDGKVFVNGAQVIKTDIETSNGVIHVIDTVLIPEADEAAKS